MTRYATDYGAFEIDPMPGRPPNRRKANSLSKQDEPPAATLPAQHHSPPASRSSPSTTWETTFRFEVKHDPPNINGQD